jgi:tetratricopeptide (TPR) repeat protein
MMLQKQLAFLALLLVALSTSILAQEWNSQLRAAVERRDLNSALSIVDARLAERPSDGDAMGWHARILAWRGEWRAAETEYRAILNQSPNDADILLGLSDVLFWQAKYSDVLAQLDRAESCGAQAHEVLKRRARTLLQLNRSNDAKQTYRALLVVDPDNIEARNALNDQLEGLRHELRLGYDSDSFNYTDNAGAQSMSLFSKWNHHWSTLIAGEFYQRFGVDARKSTASVSLAITPRNYITAGAAVANKQDVIPQYTQFSEFGHNFHAHARFIRGIEGSLEERALWFTSSHLIVLRGNVIIYLPKDWMWSVSATSARTHFADAGVSWSPSGSTSLTFPLSRYTQGHIFFATGTETYSSLDQIGQFSARTVGGGLRFHLTKYQDISLYGAYQSRSQERTQTSAGISYAIRF